MLGEHTEKMIATWVGAVIVCLREKGAGPSRVASLAVASGARQRDKPGADLNGHRALKMSTKFQKIMLTRGLPLRGERLVSPATHHGRL
jgi:hypothetical protein